MNIPQTSASDRYEAARKALEAFDRETEGQTFSPHDYPTAEALAMADALRALIAPPSVGLIGKTYAREAMRSKDIGHMVPDGQVEELISTAFRAGIQWDAEGYRIEPPSSIDTWVRLVPEVAE